MDGDRIIKLMSGGPKNNASETKGGYSAQKVKGITLNHRAYQIVTLEAPKTNDSSKDSGRTGHLSS